MAMMMTATAGYVVTPRPSHEVPVSITQPALHRSEKQTTNYVFDKVPIHHPAYQQQQKEREQQQHQQQRTISYDLGLGKNAPVGFIQSNVHPDDDVYEAVQHWDHHQTVNEYPNPEVVAQARAAMMESIAQKASAEVQANRRQSAKRRTMRKVIPQRFFGEQFPITEQQQQKVDTPRTIPTMESRESVVRQYDLNTPWVEMLIHEQQLKFA